MHLGRIDAENAVQRAPDIERGGVDLLGLYAWLGELSDRFWSLVAQCSDQDFELAVAIQHLRLVDIVEFQNARTACTASIGVRYLRYEVRAQRRRWLNPRRRASATQATSI